MVRLGVLFAGFRAASATRIIVSLGIALTDGKMDSTVRDQTDALVLHEPLGLLLDAHDRPFMATIRSRVALMTTAITGQ